MIARRLRGFGARLLRSLAHRLPPPRDEALLGFGRAVFVLITGRAPTHGVTAYREPKIDGAAFGRAERALEAGAAAEALAGVDRLYHDEPRSLRVLRLRRAILAQMGDMDGQAAMLHQIHVLDPTPENRAAEHRFLGRVTELSPGWRPRIPGPPRPVDPPDPAAVLVLNKESSPFLTTGFTMRSRYNLRAVRDAGYRPHVVTALGFPRLLGVSDFPALELVDEVPHHRLDLGPAYPLDSPVDRILEDQAWLTARVARGVRPAIIHASSGHRGYEHALVGLALREHLDRPMVYEVRSFFESVWSGSAEWGETGQHYQRRFEAETGAMRAADHVITIGEAMRDEIVERGVDPARVTIVPNGVDADAFTPRAADPALARRYGLAGSFTFGYVSNLDHPRENQELLIDAVRELRGRGRQVRCLIVGDGKRREELERHARAVGVAGDVVFTGRVAHDEVADHYALLDAFVVPRADERAARMVTPLKPFEAMAMARPMIVADLPALVEIVAPESRGLRFRTGDAADLATAVERLIDDPALAGRLGAAGREWVVRERTWAANAPRFRDVYGEVLERWGAARTLAA